MRRGARGQLRAPAEASWRAAALPLPLHCCRCCCCVAASVADGALHPSSDTTQVIDSPEVLSVVDGLPHLRPFLASLYDCKYAEFFQASA